MASPTKTEFEFTISTGGKLSLEVDWTKGEPIITVTIRSGPGLVNKASYEASPTELMSLTNGVRTILDTIAELDAVRRD